MEVPDYPGVWAVGDGAATPDPVGKPYPPTAQHAIRAGRVLAENRPHGGIELLFTPMEEIGLIGAYAFDDDRLQAQLGYVYDQAAPIGEIILGAPWAQGMEVRFHGRASHSGMFPEEGRSAIQAAAAPRSSPRRSPMFPCRK